MNCGRDRLCGAFDCHAAFPAPSCDDGGYDNGIKLIDCYGEKMPEETPLLVEDYIDGKLHVFDKDWPELPFAHREHIGRTVDYVAGRNRYMGYLISLGIYSFKGVKVGLDCANCASWNIAKSVFDALGADTYVINNKPNGTNINNNAGSTHIEGLQKFMVENGLDVGFAFDGDADRCLCVDENGNFTQENFQDRNRHKEGGTAQLLELVCKEGENYYKPSFTIMGFRYAKVETDIDLTGAEFTAHAAYSEMPVTGSFACGNADVDQLVKNSVWSQKGNFCDIPTDCPTRERTGWTGDMGVFIETGLTLMECYPVVEKWLAECLLNQYPDGRMANIAPSTSRPAYMTPMLCMSAGWGDAAILVPYALYKRTGDRKILTDNYQMMQKWYAFLLGRAQQTTEEQQTGAYAKYTVLNGLDYGEWCEPGITHMQAMMNPRKSVGTAYLAYSGRLLAEIAQALGKAEDAAQYRDTAEKAVKAYRAAFTNNGTITSDRQCEYVRAIAFALLGEEESQAAADTLNRMVVENGYHLNTGFLSTPFLCEVLAKYGYADTAYKLLLQDIAPSWLYEVKQGATTVWETWTGIDANGHPSESLNHYSYGAICGWLFGGVCGIHLAGETLTIAPTPNPALGWAKAVYDSPVGRIESGWQYAGDAVTYTITVPCNRTAEVTLPDGRSLTLQPGTHTL